MRTSNNTVIITGADLSPGHEYEVVVQAVSSQGLLQSPDDSPRAVIVLKGKETTPSQPSGLAALGGIVKISLTWDVQTDKDFDVMEIWRSPYDDFTTAVKVAEVKTTSWTDNLGSTGLTRYYWIRARNTSGKTSLTYPESGDSGISATTSGVTPTDIDDFAITATKLFTNTVILTGDTWTNNSPIAGSIAWNAHYIVFAGEYWQIPAGNTALRYVCWNQDIASGDGTVDDPYISQYVGYATYAYASGRFNIATNESGVAQLVWNASANMVIGSAFILNAAITEAKIDSLAVTQGKIGLLAVGTAQIDNLAVTDAKINSLTVAKLTAGTISSKEIVLSITAGTGDCAIRAGKTDFTNTETGFILGLDDSDSDKPKFYIGDATTYLNWDGAGLTIKGSVTITGGSGVANLTDAGSLAVLDAVGASNCNTTIITDGKIITGLLTADNVQAGTLTGRTVQTAAAVGGHGQRIVLSQADNTLRFHTDTVEDVIIIDDTISGSRPGIKIEDAANGVGAIFKKNAATQVTLIEDGIHVYSGFNSYMLDLQRSETTVLAMLRLNLASGKTAPMILCELGAAQVFKVQETGDITNAGFVSATGYINSGSYVNAAGGFKDNGTAGIDKTFSFTDNDTFDHSIVISGGIITQWNIT